MIEDDDDLMNKWPKTIEEYYTELKLDLLNEFIKFKKSENPLKLKYLKFIQNLKIDLNARWEVFREAPIEFKEQESWIVHFKIEKKLKTEINWYDDFYIDRYQTVEMINIIENLECDLSPDEYGFDERTKSGWTIELVNEFKEEILAKNLGSFKMDW